ncbi:MAG: hypothetical protein EA376_11630 [Phycisphaeraceae bacterium]|nr:MAG: hypothetical protein EA376_11630 [Phycisphaeraceae bacterium]
MASDSEKARSRAAYLVPAFVILVTLFVFIWGTAPNFGPNQGQILQYNAPASAMQRLANTLGASEITPTITDDMLHAAFAQVVARAEEGEPEAVAFLFEVARIQRASAEESADE